MPEVGIRSVYSQCPFQIQMWDQQGTISAGTGFFYESAGELLLITNWHNVSGRHFLTSDPLDGNIPARYPTFIKAKLAAYVGPTGGSEPRGFTTIAKRFEIYGQGAPLWFEHPNLGQICDVVAVPVQRPDDCPSYMHPAANQIKGPRIPVLPGGDVSVIGFPMAMSVGIGLPLWKSGYIASEPHFDVQIGGMTSEVGGLIGGTDLPAFFIDAQTREGMSGSPVFASYTGSWDSSNPYEGFDFGDPNWLKRGNVFIGSTAREFVGCYSGRTNVREHEAGFGLCWRRDVIDLICSSRQIGKDPHLIPS